MGLGKDQIVAPPLAGPHHPRVLGWRPGEGPVSRAEPPPPRRGTLPTLRELLGLLGLLLRPGRDRAGDVYELLGSHNNLGRRSLYVNLGYWAEAEDYDAACEDLARQLGHLAELGPGQRVLDAGFGFADQDMLWVRELGVDEILGRNLSPTQLARARERVAAAGMAARIRLELGSALATGAPDAHFDRVVALESAFHFRSREAFFHEAFRVLRPGGVLALADLAAVEGRPERGLVERLLGFLGRRLWQVPEENMVPATTYRAQLEGAGFHDVQVRSIAEHVFAPFKRHARARQAEADLVARANPLLRLAWSLPTVDRSPLDYLLVRARKPGGTLPP